MIRRRTLGGGLAAALAAAAVTVGTAGSAQAQVTWVQPFGYWDLRDFCSSAGGTFSSGVAGGSEWYRCDLPGGKYVQCSGSTSSSDGAGNICFYYTPYDLPPSSSGSGTAPPLTRPPVGTGQPHTGTSGAA
jgi:hypothetical protein